MDNNFKVDQFKGVIFMILASLFFAINDSLVKFAVKDIQHDNALFQVIFIRGFITCFLILMLIIFSKKLEYKKLFYDKRSYIRAVFEVMAAFSFLISLIMMPMADVYTLLNTAPLIITAAGAILLKEKVGLRRWSAVVIGFIGVLFVVNPTELKFGYIVILPLLTAIFLTFRDVVTRGYKQTSNSLEIIFITSLFVTIAFGVVSFFFASYISYNNLIYIFISSIALTMAYLFSVLTIIYAPLSLTSSTRYSVIIFGIIFGYIFFNEIPSINMIIGAIIISLSGLFVINRQKKLGKIN